MTEQILVIPRDCIEHFTGISDQIDILSTKIKENGVFKDRPAMEEDPSFLQIIPYVVIKHNDKYFLYERLSKAGESRLHNKFSVGVGGHINPIDGTDDIIREAAIREFREELDHTDEFKAELVGFLNLEDSDVDKVHMGAVFMFNVDSDEIDINEAEKDQAQKLGFFTKEELQEKKERLEGWSQEVLKIL